MDYTKFKKSLCKFTKIYNNEKIDKINNEIYQITKQKYQSLVSNNQL